MHPVRLTGDKVVLREFRPDDEDAVLGSIGEDAVTYWLSFDSRDRRQTAAMPTCVAGLASAGHAPSTTSPSHRRPRIG
jgi:hypothetical protein